MSELPYEDTEPKISPEVFNEAMGELIRLLHQGYPLSQAENQGLFDYEEFLDVDVDDVVGRQSRHKTPYEGMILDIDILMYGEAANSLAGDHAMSYLFVTLLDSEGEFLTSTKYRFHIGGTVIKSHTSGSQLLTNDDVETSKKFLQDLGIDLAVLDITNIGPDESMHDTEELKKLVHLLSKVPHSSRVTI